MSSLEIGDCIAGRYEILPNPKDGDEVAVGQGGFGILYCARDENFGDLVAIKEYFPGDIARRGRDGSITVSGQRAKAEFSKGLEELRQEALTLRRFNNHNIVRVLDIVEDFNTAYIVMEWIEGETLAERIGQREGRRQLSPHELRPLLTSLLGALETLHGASPQVLHRDIKPSNIMIRDSDGSPVLIDFGAARQITAAASQRLTTILTPGYAPYEQYVLADEEFEEAYGDLGSAVGSLPRQGPPTDFYSLGAVCHFALTGAKPRDAVRRRLERLPYKPLAERIEAPAADLPLLRSIDKALAVEPKDRFQSASAWLAALTDAGGANAGSGDQGGGGGGGGEGPSRPIWPIIVGGVVLLVVALIVLAASGRSGSHSYNSANTATDYNIAVGDNAAGDIGPMNDVGSNGMVDVNAALPDLGNSADANSSGTTNIASLAPPAPERRATARPANGVRYSNGPNDRYMIVQNLCSRPITVLLNWRSSGVYQRTPTYGWTIDSNSARILGVNGFDIFPESSTAYYSVYHSDESPPTSTDGNRVFFRDESSVSGWRTELSTGSEGHYMLIFCQRNRRTIWER